MRRDVFQAIADPTRRAIIMMLATQAMTPNALAGHFETSRQAVSKHLQVLQECDLLRADQTGREIYYYLNANKVKDVEKWLQKLRAVLDKKFAQLDEVLQTMKKR